MTFSLASVRHELMMYVAKETHLQQEDAIKLVNIVFTGIRQLLLEDKKIHIRNFGAFSVSNCKATSGRNP